MLAPPVVRIRSSALERDADELEAAARTYSPGDSRSARLIEAARALRQVAQINRKILES